MCGGIFLVSGNHHRDLLTHVISTLSGHATTGRVISAHSVARRSLLHEWLMQVCGSIHFKPDHMRESCCYQRLNKGAVWAPGRT
jgi:hypothetical protein